MDEQEEYISTSPVSSLLENEIPSPLTDCVHARSYIGLVGSVTGIGAEMIYSNLNYTIPGKGKKEAKQIVKNCSGFMGTGVNAILGPTGSGKTTLLGMLAGRANNDWMKGDIFMNGERIKESFRLQSGFVVQDDLVMGTLTVRENLTFSAALRLSSEFTESDRKVRVEQIIKDLELSQCADTKVGTDERRGISGGERKRTSIGMELIISPDVLFLDEPTTGLDASTAYTVVKLLKRQAKQGRTVIFSIHQPRYSIFKLFDTLTLLSNGETVYHGPCDKSLKYFEAIGYRCETYNNPADHYLDVIRQHGTVISKGLHGERKGSTDEERTSENERTVEVSKKLQDLYQASTYYLETCLRIQPVVDSFENSAQLKYTGNGKRIDHQSSFWRQTKILSKRVVKNVFRDPRTLFSQVVLNLITALIIGGVFYQLNTNKYGLNNRNGAIYFVVVYMAFSNINALNVFLDEKQIFRHEVASGYYRVSSYFISRVFCDLFPMRLFPVLTFSAITYFMVGFRLEASKFFIYSTLLFLTSFSVVSLCMLVSSLVDLLAVANLLVTVPLILMVLFCGFLIRIEDLPKCLQWLQYLSIFRYGLAGLQLNELQDMEFKGCGAFNDTCISGNQYLSDNNLQYAWGIVEGIIALSSVSVALLILTFAQLYRMNKIR